MSPVFLLLSSCDPGLQSEEVFDIDAQTVRLTNNGNSILKYSPSWSPDGKRIAFVQEIGGTVAFQLAIDGNHQALPILKEAEAWTDVTLSPNGTKIVYVSRTSGYLTVRSLAGGAETVLAPEVRQPYNPVWSPDGRLIAFNSRALKESPIRAVPVYVVQASGGAAQQVTESDTAVSDICGSFHPDGETLAIESNRTGNSEIWIVNVRTRALQQLTKPTRNKHAPTFSPKGDMLAYATYEDTCNSLWADLWLMPIEGAPARKLASIDINVTRMALAPDGNTLVAETQDWPSTIYAVPLATGKPMRVDNYDGFQRPSWYPDGQSLFVSRRVSNRSVYVIDVENPQIVKLSDVKIDTAFSPVWLNDREIAFLRRYDIWKIGLSGGRAERITTTMRERFRTYRGNLEISPDRMQFCFEGERGDIFMQSVKGDPEINLTAHISESLGEPTWSPDGQQIACRFQRGLKVFAVVSDKLVERKAMTGPYAEPAWSPSIMFGENLAFLDFGANGISMTSLQDLKPRLIIHQGQSGAWSPDGTRLAYVKNYYDLYVSRVFDDMK